jgi:hypothetical protein
MEAMGRKEEGVSSYWDIIRGGRRTGIKKRKL